MSVGGRCCPWSHERDCKALDPNEVYAALAPEARARILDSLGIRARQPTADMADLQLTSIARVDLEACLETLAILSDTTAATLLKAALTELSIGSEDFARYPSALERAADLWARNPGAAKQALRWWQANIEVRRQSLIAAYAIPPDIAPADLTGDAVLRLQGLVAQAFQNSLQPADIRLFQVSKRPSPWPGREHEQVIQIDIKRSSDPETVEIDEDGTISAKSLRFIVPILVVIDPARRALYVMSKTNPRHLRQAVAMAVLQTVYGTGGNPDQLPKLFVHPGKLAQRPAFRFPRGTNVLEAQVAGLIYRNLDEPGVRRSVVAEDPTTDLYDLVDLARPDATQVVSEATIRFGFSEPRQKPRYRTCTIRQPNDMAFPHFSSRDRAHAEAFLTDNGLIDPDPFKGHLGPFDVLAGLTRAAQRWRIKAAISDRWTQALLDIGVLAPGPPACEAHCVACDRDYAVQLDDNSGLHVLACPEHLRAVSDTEIETLRFFPQRLAEWLAGCWETDTARPHENPPECWDLGIMPGVGRRAGLPMMLATGTDTRSSLVAISERIASLASRPAGRRCLGEIDCAHSPHWAIPAAIIRF